MNLHSSGPATFIPRKKRISPEKRRPLFPQTSRLQGDNISFGPGKSSDLKDRLGRGKGSAAEYYRLPDLLPEVVSWRPALGAWPGKTGEKYRTARQGSACAFRLLPVGKRQLVGKDNYA